MYVILLFSRVFHFHKNKTKKTGEKLVCLCVGNGGLGFSLEDVVNAENKVIPAL
jgi:hypothetical protein